MTQREQIDELECQLRCLRRRLLWPCQAVHLGTQCEGDAGHIGQHQANYTDDEGARRFRVWPRTDPPLSWDDDFAYRDAVGRLVPVRVLVAQCGRNHWDRVVLTHRPGVFEAYSYAGRVWPLAEGVRATEKLGAVPWMALVDGEPQSKEVRAPTKSGAIKFVVAAWQEVVRD